MNTRPSPAGYSRLPSGTVAFVPGGYGDIGTALSGALARAGASVMIGGRNADAARRLSESLNAQGLRTAWVQFDARDVSSIRQAVDTTVQVLGGLHILVNCVGIQMEERVLDVTESAFDEVVQVNLKASMFLAQAAARRQIESVYPAGMTGRQIHVLSVRAVLGLQNRGYSAYCATKGALAMLVRQHAVELGTHGITVNGVAPTVVEGSMARHWLDDPVIYQQVIQRIPLRRVAVPDDIVAPTLMFCSPGAAFVTGQVLLVDGGLTATQ